MQCSAADFMFSQAVGSHQLKLFSVFSQITCEKYQLGQSLDKVKVQEEEPPPEPDACLLLEYYAAVV